jgi:uncharacterized protein YgbK (DUF1537 family)
VIRRDATTGKHPAENPLIGCIADDFTGATDLSGLLRRSGMSVVQCFGIPNQGSASDPARARALVSGYDAIVVALKTRSIPADAACEQSCDAARWLQSLGSRRFFFKYCSTFDSTDRGNIGPVAEALMELLGVRQTIFCPSFPENGRTVYHGHLFVGDRLLHESGMQHHPLNPMTDANLVRVLSAQSNSRVGLLSASDLADSPLAVRSRLDSLPPLVIADATDDSQLGTIAHAVADHKLVTGGSAIAGQIADVLRARGEFDAMPNVDTTFPSGRAAVLSGSCSRATLEQIATFADSHPWLQLDVAAAAADHSVLERAKSWIGENFDRSPLLITTSTDPGTLQAVQAAVGRQRAAETAETLLSELAAYLVELGVRRLVVAGGETSGAVTQRLGFEAIRIGPEIAPGVPWTESLGEPRIALALKSGNFGSRDFFQDAIDLLQ